ncbi:hypothetical protein [Trinickia dabaoshanensis]|uniref:hypothetical protein n=1 Tax=Trinickia dabaoshanensis TaxID=564714 RepID=UPI0011AFCA39|nr:hypothetical protein [Trinickia dabaoshanensis]
MIEFNRHPAAGTPAIGEYWQGQGGIYAGIMPDYAGTSSYHLSPMNFLVPSGTGPAPKTPLKTRGAPISTGWKCGTCSSPWQAKLAR